MIQELQINKLEHLFNIIDFNHNGLLTKSDFEGIADNVAIFAGILEENGNECRLRETGYQIWDYIKSYFGESSLLHITIDQWMDFMENEFIQPETSKLDQKIRVIVSELQKVFDKNNDQLLSRLEFMCIFVSFRVEVRYANECFKAIDLNSDGFISTEELVQAATDFFKSTDPEALGNRLFGEIGSTHFTSARTQF